MQRLIIDRFEGSFAICEDEDRKMHEIPRSLLPGGAKPGSVLYQTSQGYHLDVYEEANRKKRIQELENKLFED